MKIYKGIDVFKLLAAVGVVAIHSNLMFFKTLGRMGVPFFVIISSFFFFRKYVDLDSQNQKQRLIIFEKRILYLFLCWEVFYIPLALKNLVNFVQDKGLSLRTFASYIYHFLFTAADAVNGWGPSWYLIAMMIGLVIFILLLKIFKSNLWVIGIICILVEIYYILANEFAMYTHFNDIGTHGFPRLLIYIFIGYLIVKMQVSITNKSLNFYLSLFLVFLTLFVIENIIIWKLGGSSNSQEVIMSGPTSASMAILSIKWQPSITSTLMYKKFSTFLYCVQAWPMWMLGHFINIESSFLNEVIVFGAIMVFAFVTFKIYLLVQKKIQWKFWSYMV